MSLGKCPLGCAFYEEEECCIGCALCIATNKEEMIIAEERLNKYLELSTQEREEFMQKGAYFEE